MTARVRIAFDIELDPAVVTLDTLTISDVIQTIEEGALLEQVEAGTATVMVTQADPGTEALTERAWQQVTR